MRKGKFAARGSLFRYRTGNLLLHGRYELVYSFILLIFMRLFDVGFKKKKRISMRTPYKLQNVISSQIAESEKFL